MSEKGLHIFLRLPAGCLLFYRGSQHLYNVCCCIILTAAMLLLIKRIVSDDINFVDFINTDKIP